MLRIRDLAVTLVAVASLASVVATGGQAFAQARGAGTGLLESALPGRAGPPGGAQIETLAYEGTSAGRVPNGVAPIASPPAAPKGAGENAAAARTPPPAAAKGVGATFPQPVYLRWAALYAAETGETIGYDGLGSGAGIKAIQEAAVTFGASDTPLDDVALKDDALVQFPTMVGGIVPVVDLPGVGPGDLVLDGETLADLFMGRIAFWDDPALAVRNPHLPLPHLAVTVVRRSDSSGTTSVFAAYLAASSHRDQTWLGQHPPILRPLGIAAPGSRGMADAVASTAGAIGYVGFDDAQARRLTYVELVNPAGRVVQPTLASIAAAAATADWSHGMVPSLIARPGGASWPLVSATYVLMHRINNDSAAALAALRFFDWATRSGGPAAEDLGFVPLPADATAEVRRIQDPMREAATAWLGPRK